MSKHPTSVIDLCAREVQIALAVSPCEGELLHTPRRSGFSYPTTSTMAFFRSAYPVAYLPIKAAARIGKSHIKPFKDGIRFLLIIFKIATLYSPLKLFAPASVVVFLLGCANYAYTIVAYHRLTNMSTLLWSAAVIVFLIGLVSEQITGLMYRRDV